MSEPDCDHVDLDGALSLLLKRGHGRSENLLDPTRHPDAAMLSQAYQVAVDQLKEDACTIRWRAWEAQGLTVPPFEVDLYCGKHPRQGPIHQLQPGVRGVGANWFAGSDGAAPVRLVGPQIVSCSCHHVDPRRVAEDAAETLLTGRRVTAQWANRDLPPTEAWRVCIDCFACGQRWTFRDNARLRQATSHLGNLDLSRTTPTVQLLERLMSDQRLK